MVLINLFCPIFSLKVSRNENAHSFGEWGGKIEIIAVGNAMQSNWWSLEFEQWSGKLIDPNLIDSEWIYREIWV
jgi:hypothetical protein